MLIRASVDLFYRKSPDNPRARRRTIHEKGFDREDPGWDPDGHVYYFQLAMIFLASVIHTHDDVSGVFYIPNISESRPF
jgi:hypothetical protein